MPSLASFNDKEYLTEVTGNAVALMQASAYVKETDLLEGNVIY